MRHFQKICTRKYPLCGYFQYLPFSCWCGSRCTSTFLWRILWILVWSKTQISKLGSYPRKKKYIYIKYPFVHFNQEFSDLAYACRYNSAGPYLERVPWVPSTREKLKLCIKGPMKTVLFSVLYYIVAPVDWFAKEGHVVYYAVQVLKKSLLVWIFMSMYFWMLWNRPQKWFKLKNNFVRGIICGHIVHTTG